MGKGNRVSLRDYIDTKTEAIETAIKVALTAMDRRMDAANEFRATIEGLVHNAVTRKEYSADQQRTADDIKFLRESRAMLEGKASQEELNKTGGRALVGITIGVISLIMSIISIILRLFGK